MEEVFNQGTISLVDELLAPDFVEHEQLPPGVPPGREALKVLPAMFRRAFPDFKVAIDDVIGEGDKVVVRSTWSGTHNGDFMGIAPTGQRVSFEVIDILRLAGGAGGKFVEHWGQMDNMALMQQLGVSPADGG